MMPNITFVSVSGYTTCTYILSMLEYVKYLILRYIKMYIIAVLLEHLLLKFAVFQEKNFFNVAVMSKLTSTF